MTSYQMTKIGDELLFFSSFSLQLTVQHNKYRADLYSEKHSINVKFYMQCFIQKVGNPWITSPSKIFRSHNYIMLFKFYSPVRLYVFQGGRPLSSCPIKINPVNDVLSPLLKNILYETLGSLNHKTSNIVDHAKSEQHTASMAYHWTVTTKASNQRIRSYAPIACCWLTMDSCQKTRMLHKLEICYVRGGANFPQVSYFS